MKPLIAANSRLVFIFNKKKSKRAVLISRVELHLRALRSHLAPQTAGGRSRSVNCDITEPGRRLTCACEQEIRKKKEREREHVRARERQ